MRFNLVYVGLSLLERIVIYYLITAAVPMRSCSSRRVLCSELWERLLPATLGAVWETAGAAAPLGNFPSCVRGGLQ
jgi:hypothetical protein